MCLNTKISEFGVPSNPRMGDIGSPPPYCSVSDATFPGSSTNTQSFANMSA